MTLLREGLLDGVRVAVAALGVPEVAERLAGLGASIEDVSPLSGLDDEAADAFAAARAPLHALVLDASEALGAGGRDGMRAALDGTWEIVRALAVGALIPGGGGAVVLIAPAGSEPFTGAVRDGLENLARTLSTEWARHGITLTAVCPARDTDGDDLATVVAFLVSDAGRYLSGGRLELGAAPVAARRR